MKKVLGGNRSADCSFDCHCSATCMVHAHCDDAGSCSGSDDHGGYCGIKYYSCSDLCKSECNNSN